MAYLVDIAQTGSTAGGTGYTVNLPPHQTNDYLVLMGSVDTGTLAIASSSTTWTAFSPASVTQGNVNYAWYVKCASAAETLTMTSADATAIMVMCFREVDTTTPFDGVTPLFNGVATATTTPVGQSLTTTTANALVVSMVAVEGTNPMVVTDPGAMSVGMSDSSGTTATLSADVSAGWYIQRTAGASPAIPFRSNVSGAYARLSFALRAASGARIPPYIDDVTSPATLLHNGSYSATVNGVSHTTNGITATINGKTATPTTAALLVDSGLDPYLSILTSAAAATAVTALVGPEVTITTAVNVTGKLVAGAVMAGNWKQAKFGVGSLAQGGVVVRLGSGSAGTTAWNAYQVSAKDAAVPPATPAVFVIEPGYSGTSYANGSTNCDVTAVKYLQVLRNAPLFSSQVGLTECYVVDKQIIAGGDATYPVGLDGMVAVGKSFRLPLIQKAGAAAVVCFAPVQIGGGDAVNFQVDSGVVQFPKRASVAAKDVQYHASDNKVGLYLAGKSGDTVKLTNSLITSPTPAVFEVTSGATSAATWDLNNNTFIGMTTTLRPVTTYSGEVFTNCPSVTTTGSTISGSTFTNSPISVSSPANAALISSSTIAKNTGTAHGITITGTAADITLTGLTFTGFASSNGSTGNEAIYVNIASGTMTINISGGTTPSIRTAGATVTVQNAVSVTVTVKDAKTLTAVENARVRIVTTVGSNLVLEGATNSSGVLTGSTTYVGSAVTGTVRRATVALGTLYKPYDISGTVGGGGLDVTALLTSDE
jgi:hypothetical protein